MRFLISEFQLVLRRSLANWRLLSTVIAGVVVTVALLSSTPFYANAINELGLSHALRKNRIEMLDLQVYAPNYTISYENYYDAQAIIEQQVSRNIRSVVRQAERWIKSQEYFAGWADRPIPTDANRPEGYFHVFTNLADHIEVIDGRLAAPPRAGLTADDVLTPGFAIEGMIGSETAEKFGVGVGDRLVFLVGYGASEKRINIDIAAVIDPIDPDEEFWLLKTDVFTGDGLVAPIFIPEQTLFEVINLYDQATRATYNWLYFVDLNRIDTENAATIEQAIERMDRQLVNNLPRVGMFTSLAVVIREYQSKLMYTQIPLFLIISQIVAVILFYLVTVSNMLIERQAAEIALFRSRGASTWQIIGIFFSQGLLITAIGAAIGPFLGALVFSLLGTTATFQPLTGGAIMPVRFTESVWLLTLIAMLLCLITLLVPAIQAARRGVVHQRQQAARPHWLTVWHRFYLDIVLLVLGGVLYWELKERGSLLTLDVFGGIGMDPILLVTPMLLLMAVAIVFLRLFPIVASLATRLSRYVSNPAAVLGLWYMARNPVHYTRLILLLIMAASVGMFSATFVGTLERNYNERSLYAAGSDVRLERFNDWNTPKSVLQQRYSSVAGVQKSSPAYRGNGTVGTLFTQTESAVLAVDPAVIGEIAWYRDDFSANSLAVLLAVLAKDAPLQQGLRLPNGTTAIGLWAYPEEGNIRTAVYATVTDAAGRYLDIRLGSTANQTWHFLQADIIPFWSEIAYPIYLESIYVRPQSGGAFSSLQGISFDDLQTRSSSAAEWVVVEDFEDLIEWTVAAEEVSTSFSGQGGGPTTRFAVNKRVFRSGESSGRLGWGGRRGSSPVGIYAEKDLRPLSAIASRSFLDNSHLNVNDFIQVRMSGQLVPVSIDDVADYFPTIDPANQGFLILNLDRLSSVRALDSAPPFYPNEVWLSLDGDSQRAETIDILKSPPYHAYATYDSVEMMQALRTDPLAGAGWSGVMMIAFLGVILVSSLGFVLYSYLSAQQRQLDFAILRTLGFSLRQIIGLVCFEQLFILAVGMGLGTVIGERLSYIMVPFLQLTERGERVLPPFVLTIHWGVIAMAYAILALAFIITITLVIRFFNRVAIHRTLRMGNV